MPRVRKPNAWLRFVDLTLEVVGSFWSFVASVAFLTAWAVVGLFDGFSNTWQLVLNTVASVIAFVLVFLIQYSQNRDTRALHLKLDEVLRSVSESPDRFVHLERKNDSEIEELGIG